LFTLGSHATAGEAITVPKGVFHLLDGTRHRLGHGAKVSLHNSESQFDLTTFSTVFDLLLAKEAFALLSLAGGRFLVNKRELAANQTLFVTNQVSDVDKGSTDVN
jgi:hypothetical protein